MTLPSEPKYVRYLIRHTTTAQPQPEPLKQSPLVIAPWRRRLMLALVLMYQRVGDWCYQRAESLLSKLERTSGRPDTQVPIAADPRPRV